MHILRWAGFSIVLFFAVLARAADAPALVLVLMIDGLPQEQLVKYRDQYARGGFSLLLDKGAWFSDAHQAHAVTLTAPGHAAVLTGSYPYQNGIIANEWTDRRTLAQVYNTGDPAHTYIGEETRKLDGTSPANLRVSTVGDELRYANGGRSKVLTISGKDRGAILLGGRRGLAYMYMDQSGRFASTTYYMKEHPEWHARYYAARPQDKWFGQSWAPLLPEAAYARSAPDGAPGSGNLVGMGTRFPFVLPRGERPDQKYYNALMRTPFGDEATLDFARAAVEGEQLGSNPAGVPDILGISLSTHDYVNHTFGPQKVVIVFTADHGFQNVADYSAANGLPGLRVDTRKLMGDLNTHLQQRLGASGPVARLSNPTIVLDPGLGERRAEAEAAAARFLADYPGVAAIFTRTQLESGSVGGAGRLGTLVQRAWNRQLSGDLYLVLRPYALLSGFPTGTTHGSPYSYDTNVPLVFYGPRWINAGKYGQNAAVVDIAPTLSHLLEIRPPGASEGRILTEILR
jgi:hypothetical protein